MSNVARIGTVGIVLIAVALWGKHGSEELLKQELGARPASGSRERQQVLQQSSAAEEGDPTKERPQVGYKAPEIGALTTDGTDVLRTLANYPNQVVLVYVWTTWCGWCRKEMPELEALHREFRGQGLFVLAVGANGDNDLLRETALERGLTFDILRDDGKATAKAYAVRGYPMTVIIDRYGIIRHTSYGYGEDNYQQNVVLISKLLAE